ncbi:GNAT family protein [Bradyrhizobium sp.]|uniref:GNAT family N-acetyltransferase n=1 Tax=Bradyrhizobium sp. TaxID=376 RepID=UPI00263969B2|nr:GNAT family protein [Bradyrhizobium sp.]
MLTVREMTVSETDIIVDYFLNATPEYMETLGLDPTRFPAAESFRKRLRREAELPIEQCSAVLVIWLQDGEPVGFSTADEITYGAQAHMHIHIVDPEHRNSGIGAECVPLSVALYFERLKLKRLFCEPYAFNIAPNRTLQKAGFKYLKTHMSAPGPYNFHQAVNCWVIERQNVLGSG